MPRFAANLSVLFTDVPFLDRFERAALAGFDAVEFLFPYAHAPADIQARLVDHGLALVLFNSPPGGDGAAGRGMACDPSRIAEFRSGIAQAIDYAHTLGTPRIHVLTGMPPTGTAAEVVHRTVLENLRFSAAELKRAGLDALIEPLNAFDNPGYYLNCTRQALELMDEVGADNLLLQYDIYHAQRSEGELAATIERHLPKIGHMQLADNPGRHEPGSGEINYGFLFAHIDRIGYRGHIGCEYRPAGATEAGLGWLHQAWRDAPATAPSRAAESGRIA